MSDEIIMPSGNRSKPGVAALEKGTRLGPYEILSPLGAGGMGEVYLASDSKLDRKVAIKVLPESMTRDIERVARFEREAKLLASLNHPNIAAIHGFDDLDGTRFLVMEYVEGQTLGDHLRNGPVAVEDALDIGKKIAEALEAAHEQGVIHRDLKPANVMIREDGTVKVLDFGLAKAMAKESSGSLAAESPTITANYTRPGVILGTAAYMSPEQTRGQTLDKRTDIWSFGIMLYECLTGAPLFEGETANDSIGAILHKDPDWSLLPPDTPPTIQLLLRRCLAKDRKRRLHDIADARIELELAGAALHEAPRKYRRVLGVTLLFAGMLVGALSVFLATVVLGIISFRNAPSPPESITAAIRPPADARFVFTDDSGGPAVVSPDGRTIAFKGRSKDGIHRLWVRRLEDGSAKELPGTEDCYFPFWSPDSKSVAFFASKKLKRISLAGGMPVVLCDAVLGKGGTWTPAGEILFSPSFDRGIVRVASSGGTPTPITRLEGDAYTTHRWPVILPDGEHFLYFAGNTDLSHRGNDGIFLASQNGTVNKMVVKTRGNAVYASGHLLYLRNDTLMAQRFDAERGALTGEPVPIASNVQYDQTVWRGVFSASENGVLIYQTGLAPSGSTLTWFDRTGTNLERFGEHAVYDNQFRISPDGTHIATAVGDPGDVWTFDLSRGVRTRITSDPVVERHAVWSPDGTSIVYSSLGRGDRPTIIYTKPSSGTGTPRLLFEYQEHMGASDWSPDGNFLLVTLEDAKAQTDIGVLALGEEAKLIPILATPFDEAAARFSPDGRWIAYASLESGQTEVYVVPFRSELSEDRNLAPSDRAGRWQVSTNGGMRPVWARDGKTLYFLALDGTLYAVEVDTSGESFQMGTSQSLFTPDAPVTDLPGQLGSGYAYDVTPDGQRFLVNTSGSGDATPLTLVLNWTNMVSEE
jgi:serine/threonine protein kinase